MLTLLIITCLGSSFDARKIFTLNTKGMVVRWIKKTYKKD